MFIVIKYKGIGLQVHQLNSHKHMNFNRQLEFHPSGNPPPARGAMSYQECL